MSACTFFGHRELYKNIESVLFQAIENLIVYENVDTFYVGNQGQFDALVHRVLKNLEKKYSIHYAVVLAYMPTSKNEYDNLSDTMLPEGLETVHPRYAIDRRNKWMIDHSDFVIAYVTHGWGGAAKYVLLAERKSKTIIKLSGKQCKTP